jgi:hypothetical protein
LVALIRGEEIPMADTLPWEYGEAHRPPEPYDGGGYPHGEEGNSHPVTDEHRDAPDGAVIEWIGGGRAAPRTFSPVDRKDAGHG